MVGRLCPGRGTLCALFRPVIAVKSSSHRTSRHSSLDFDFPRNSSYQTGSGRTPRRTPTPHHHYQTMEISGSLVGACEILQDRLVSLLNNSPPNRRIVIALAGVPGSGKSTIAAALLAYLDKAGTHDVFIAPMVWFKTTHTRHYTVLADAHRTAITIQKRRCPHLQIPMRHFVDGERRSLLTSSRLSRWSAC